jgi:hypothetical protein
MNGSKRNWNDIGWIVFAGAAGGLLSWLYSLVLKQPLCDGVLLAFTCSIFFGIGPGKHALVNQLKEINAGSSGNE